ncbi:MAG: ABC transporter substrate-binding protein, partial [bacterium]
MSRGKLSRTVLLLVLALVLVVVGVPDPAQAQRKDTVVIGLAQEPDLLIRAFSSMLVSGEVLTSLFVGMVDLDGQWKLVPQMAVKIPTLRDGDWELLPGKKMRVTYKLKKGYTWHDGRPVTALDVSWTYLMLRNPQSPTQSRFILKKIDNMLVPNPTDPHTLVVQWNELYPFANLGHATYPRHVLEREYLRDPSTLKAHRQARAPIGNGPYRFVEWSPGSHITLEAYDAYPGGKPKIRRQVWRFILDSTVLQANVIAGQVDVTGLANNFSIDQMADIERRSPQVTAHYSPDFIWERINLNLD